MFEGEGAITVQEHDNTVTDPEKNPAGFVAYYIRITV